VSTKVGTWSEDVVEETIIREEMQVEGDGDDSYSLARDTVVVEEVLLVNEPNLENKNFVEFTVIQNEDVDESIAMTSKSEKIPSNEYQAVGKDVNSVHMNKSESSISAMHTDESVTSCSSGNSNTTDSNTDKPCVDKKKMVLEERNSKKQKNKTIYDKIRKEISESISEKVRLCSIKDDSGSSTEEDSCERENKHLLAKNMHVDTSKEDPFNKIDNKLANMRISESSREIQKLVNDLSSVESIDSPIQTP
jgi:hypothetical protein